MSNETELKTNKKFNIRISWSDENDGDLFDKFELEENDINEVWNYLFNEYFDKSVKEQFTFNDQNTGFFDMYLNSDGDLVTYNNLKDEDIIKNDDDEMNNYMRTYSVEITEEDDN